MRTLPEKYSNRIISEQLRNAYEECDKYEDQLAMSRILGIHVKVATQNERDAYLAANDMNQEKETVVIASLPKYMGNCYMIIDYNDRIKAVEIGLNVNFV